MKLRSFSIILVLLIFIGSIYTTPKQPTTFQVETPIYETFKKEKIKFIPSKTFKGSRKNMIFTTRQNKTGYYMDINK